VRTAVGLVLVCGVLIAPISAQDGAASGADASGADASSSSDVATPPAEMDPVDAARAAGVKLLVDLRPEDVLEAAKHGPAGEDTPLPAPEVMSGTIRRGVDFLRQAQQEDGSWGGWNNPAPWDEFWSNPYTHKSWIMATTGLVSMALLEEPASAEGDAALRRGVTYILEVEIPKRPSDWDVDNTWGLIYGLQALSEVLARPDRQSVFTGSGDPAAFRAALTERCTRFVEELAKYQTPTGGWGYYDFETLAERPSWATSFQTAVGLIALLQGQAVGIEVPQEMIVAARDALLRCRLPNGAYSYSVDAVPYMGMEWIDNVKGSLSRIQVCNLALVLVGEDSVTRRDLRTGLDRFFEHHRFLDVARKKPVPHEAYYLNSGYFYFFGHYYAARILELLDPADQIVYAARLAREVTKTQETDGSMWDYPFNSYDRPYGTAFGVMTLHRTMAVTRTDVPLQR